LFSPLWLAQLKFQELHRFRHAPLLLGGVLGASAKLDWAIAVVVSFHQETTDTLAAFAAL
jgi:hypothetical protein